MGYGLYDTPLDTASHLIQDPNTILYRILFPLSTNAGSAGPLIHLPDTLREGFNVPNVGMNKEINNTKSQYHAKGRNNVVAINQESTRTI